MPAISSFFCRQVLYCLDYLWTDLFSLCRVLYCIGQSVGQSINLIGHCRQFHLCSPIVRVVCCATHFFYAIIIEGEVRLISVGLWADVLIRVPIVLVIVSAILIVAMVSIVGIITTSIILVCVSAVANIVVVDAGVGVIAVTVVCSVPFVGVIPYA